MRWSDIIQFELSSTKAVGMLAIDSMSYHRRIRTIVLHMICFLVLLLICDFAFGGQAPPPTARADKGVALCNVETLPQNIQSRIKAEFSSWRLQEPTDLTALAHERWESEKPIACPGMAVGQFEKDKRQSYAILLVPKAHADAGHRFLVFTPQVDPPAYDVKLLEQSDSNGASYYFIHTVRVSKLFDQVSRRKFDVQTSECILFVGSGQEGYEADVYFWTSRAYQHQPVDY
jgi:hypothetical protein